MDRRSFLGLTLGLPLYLTACARSESYRYKLTLSLDTLDGVKSGFNVVEVSHNEVSFPARGVVAHVKGEALYLDLGPGRRPLIARLTKRQGPKGWGDGWEEDRPTRRAGAALWRDESHHRPAGDRVTTSRKSAGR